jgi:6,7-dimethyl-8-ribityllumazine synthase
VSIEVFMADLVGEGLRVGVVQARFNEPVCHALRDACLGELARMGVEEEDVFVCTVPGALEIPLALSKLARTGEFDALIALGAVIRGETYHFEVVSNESARGVMQVALEFSLPVANAILTTENDEQALARATEKGTEAARVAIEMANLGESIASLGEVPEEDSE